MPYNPYAAGGPTARDLSHTPLGRRLDGIIRESQAAAKAREASREPSTNAIRVHLASDSSRGRRYATVNTGGDYILARPSDGVWHVYPCGPRGGLLGPSQGSGTTPQDALEDAGYREVAR